MESHDSARTSKRELLSPYRSGLPTAFRRVARRSVDWELPRKFNGYTASSEHEMSIGGASSKCFLSINGELEGAYIAKFAHKNGQIETYTELFNNHLGRALGFDMAHGGIARLDGALHFLSRSFRSANEQLIHGSLMVEMLGLANATEIDQIHTLAQQQRTFDVDFMEAVIREFCGTDFPAVFEKFTAMLVFDAIIGSMDRHPRNWGVIRPAVAGSANCEVGHTRFAPIYDSARALLWDLDDVKISKLLASGPELRRYIERSSPRLGLPNASQKCTHFELLSHLAKSHKSLISGSLQSLNSHPSKAAEALLRKWPFCRVFKSSRKRAILKIINARFDQISAIA